MKKLFLIPILSLLFSAQAFGAGIAPRIDTIEVQSLPNHIINGDITFNQRGNITGATSGVYFVDRFSYVNSSTAVHNIGSSADVPTVAQSGRKSTNSLYLVLTTADTSIGASDLVFVRHKVEGYNWAQLYGKSFTLSFWVKATTTGSYSVGFRDGSNTVAYVAPYTITASDTWEKKSIVVPAPAIGTWAVDNTTGLDIAWTVASGTTYQTATTGSWVSGAYIGGTSQVNGVNTGSTVFKLAQVMLNEGTRAAPFKLAGGDVQGELAKAQRYTWCMKGTNVLLPCFARNATSIYCSVVFPVELRTQVNIVSPLSTGASYYECGIAAATYTFTGSELSSIYTSPQGYGMQWATSGLTAGWAGWCRGISASSLMCFNAEL